MNKRTEVWTPERVALLKQMRREGQTMLKIAQALGLDFTANMVAGKLARLEGRVETDRYKPTRREYTSHVRGDWDFRTFEPYAVRKQRLAEERAKSTGAAT